MAKRTKVQAFTFKIETVSGTDSVPVGTANAIRIDTTTLSSNPNILEGTEANASLDAGSPVIGGTSFGIRGTRKMAGSLAVGTAPDWGVLARACAFAETVQAVLPSTSSFAATGGTTRSVAVADRTVGNATQLPATTDSLLGMPIQFSINPATPFTSFIESYVVTGNAIAIGITDTMPVALGATTTFTIFPNVSYRPSSAAPPSGSGYCYYDGLLHKILGCRGGFDIAVQSGNRGDINFNFVGFDSGAESDTAIPTLTLGTANPPIWRAAGTGLGACLMNGIPVPAQQLTINLNQTPILPDNPNNVNPYDPGEIIGRNIQGTLNPLANTVAIDDIFARFIAGTLSSIHARWGTVAGNRFAITVPTAMYRDAGLEDRQGLLGRNIPFSCVGVDKGVIICQW